MHRFALNIDPVARIRNTMDGVGPDPVHAVVLAELGGAESIVCYFRDDQKTVTERDVNLFRQIVKSYLNVRCNLTEDIVRSLMRIKPDMVTFVAPGDAGSYQPLPLHLDTYAGQLGNHVAELRSNNILSSVLIEPEISQIKSAGKLEFDYVELDARIMAEAADMQSELEALDVIAEMAFAANKIGLGVNISGEIDQDNIRELAKIDFLEDIIIGQPVIVRALSIGLEQAVRDYLTML